MTDNTKKTETQAGADLLKSKKTIMAVEIPRDELAIRIAAPCIGMKVTGNATATEMLDDMNAIQGAVPMGEGFRRAADEAVKYFHEQINNARQPS